MSIMNMLASPSFTSRQMLVALAKDKNSFRLSIPLMIKVGLASLSVISLVAFTPLGKFFFVNMFNTPENLFPEIQVAAKFCLSLPFIYSLMAYSQGILIVQKKTQYLTYSAIVRIAIMIFLASILPKTSLKGASVGILIWALGMTFEALLNFILSVKPYKELPDKVSDNTCSFSLSKALSFLWPLILMSLVWTLGKPLINFGLSYTSNPELSLATFQVAQNFAWILMAFLETNLRQVTLIFGTCKEKIAYLKRFTIILSLILSGILALLAFTPLGSIGLLKMIKVSPELANASKNIIIALIAAPFLVACSELYMGLLMRLNNTKILSIAKIINMITVTISIYLFATTLPQIGALAGALGTLLGLGLESLVLKLAYHSHTKKI